MKVKYLIPKQGGSQREAEELQQANKTSYGYATDLWQNMCKSVDRARELPILEPMCNKLDAEWEQLISGLRERDKILNYSAVFWKGREGNFLLIFLQIVFFSQFI